MKSILLSLCICASAGLFAQTEANTEHKTEKLKLNQELRAFGPAFRVTLKATPVYGIFHADFENLGDANAVMYAVFDMSGKNVLDNSIRRKDENHFEFDLKELKPGDYFIRVVTIYNNSTQKITLK